MLSVCRQSALAMAALVAMSASALASEHRVPLPATPTIAAAVTLSQPGDVIRVVGELPVAEAIVVPHDLTVRGGVVPARLSSLVVPSGVELLLADAVVSGSAAGTCSGVCVMGGLTGTDVRFEDAPLQVLDGVVLLDDGAFVGPDSQVMSVGGVVTLTRPSHVDAVGPALSAQDSTVLVYDAVMTDIVGPAVHAVGGSVSILGGAFTGATGPAVVLEQSPATLLDVSFVGQRAERGAAVHASSTSGSTLAIDGLTAVDMEASDAGGILYADGVTAAVASWDATDVHAARGGAIAVVGGSLTATDGTVSEFSAVHDGGVVWASDAQVVVADLDATGGVGTVAARGGLVSSAGGALSVRDILANGIRVHDAGGLVHGSGDLVLTDVYAVDTAADRGGVVAWSQGTAILTGLVSEGSHADHGAVVHLSGVSEPVIQDGVWTDGTASAHGGGAWIENSTGGWVRRMRLCGLQSEAEGAGLLISGLAAGTLHIVNNILINNSAQSGGTIALTGGLETAVHVHNNTVLADSSAAALSASGLLVDVLNNLVVSAAAPVELDDDAIVTGGFNVWPANSARWPHASPSDLSTDPQLAPFRGSLCEHPVWLDADSSLRDAGSPDVLDVDGSRSDIGAHGGPHARLTDGDGDGHPADLDCDDADASVYPGAWDIPYDGLDQDCDGYDACDVDGDGVRAVQCGGADCDDADAAVGPDRPDSPYDGVDQDCDGSDLVDADGDGWAAQRAGGLDCDDGDPAVHPEADEQPGNDVDEDCDGLLGDAFLAGGAGCAITGRSAMLWPLVWLVLARRRRS